METSPAENEGIAPRKTFPWIEKPLEGLFVKRLNRFSSLVEIDGRLVNAHLPNSGRLEELLIPGSPAILERRRNEGKTLHDLLLIGSRSYPHKNPIWISLDSRLPKTLVRWALEESLLGEFGKPREIKSEPRVDSGRLDLLLRDGETPHFVETKSVNLLDISGTARFPDAPTKRGTEHIRALMELKKRGYGAWMIFVVMREDAAAFSPFEERDPPLTRSLIEARESGVGLVALRFSSGPEMIYMGKIDVILPPTPFPGLWPPVARQS
ncbi:MAG: DNA/RNA nuclease SfsA [bacterium]